MRRIAAVVKVSSLRVTLKGGHHSQQETLTMTPTFHRRTLLRASLALGAGLVAPGSRACEFFSSHLRITHPWTRASAEGATSALICMKFDEVTQADRLIGVETPVARAAELAGLGVRPALDFAIPAGQETLLSEEGIHVRLLDLLIPLEMGREYPLLLTFAGGGVIQAKLSVDYARFG
jgi:copper(I)-binding protein